MKLDHFASIVIGVFDGQKETKMAAVLACSTLGLRSDPCCIRVPIVNQKLLASEKSLVQRVTAAMTDASLMATECE